MDHELSHKISKFPVDRDHRDSVLCTRATCLLYSTSLRLLINLMKMETHYFYRAILRIFQISELYPHWCIVKLVFYSTSCIQTSSIDFERITSYLRSVLGWHLLNRGSKRCWLYVENWASINDLSREQPLVERLQSEPHGSFCSPTSPAALYQSQLSSN